MQKSIHETPEESYIRQGLAEGWITKQVISRKMIDVDFRFQGRVIHYDMEHIRNLNEIRNNKDGEYLDPVVVFQNDGLRFQLVDGFHRINENDRRPETKDAIPAWVIVRDDWEREALIYASMCNQVTRLKRSDEDKKKSVRMLLGIDGIAEWTDSQIAKNCGVSSTFAGKTRLEWAIENHKPLPAPKRRKTTKTKPMLVLPPGADIEPEDIAHPPYHNTRSFRDWALRRGVRLEMIKGTESRLRLNGLTTKNRVVALCERSTVESLYQAIGSVLILREIHAPSCGCIVVGPDQEGKNSKVVAGWARRFGIAITSAEEFITESQRGDAHIGEKNAS